MYRVCGLVWIAHTTLLVALVEAVDVNIWEVSSRSDPALLIAIARLPFLNSRLILSRYGYVCQA